MERLRRQAAVDDNINTNEWLVTSHHYRINWMKDEVEGEEEEEDGFPPQLTTNRLIDLDTEAI